MPGRRSGRISTGGNYVNFQTEDEADERTVASYRDNYARLETSQGQRTTRPTSSG